MILWPLCDYVLQSSVALTDQGLEIPLYLLESIMKFLSGVRGGTFLLYLWWFILIVDSSGTGIQPLCENTCDRLTDRYRTCVERRSKRAPGEPLSPTRIEYCKSKKERWFTRCYSFQYTQCTGLCVDQICVDALQAACDAIVESPPVRRRLGGSSHEGRSLLQSSDVLEAAPDITCVGSRRLDSVLSSGWLASNLFEVSRWTRRELSLLSDRLFVSINLVHYTVLLRSRWHQPERLIIGV